jgi:multidrug efflux pump subunit AcrA (membrane-fusion protein)
MHPMPTSEDAVSDTTEVLLSPRETSSKPYSADESLAMQTLRGKPSHRTPDAPQFVDIGKFMLFNVLIPLALIAIGVVTILVLGKVQPKQRPAADLSRAGRLKSLPAVNVEKILSLESTGAQLQLRVDGTVVPFREVRVATEVSGQIIFKAPECEAGSYVKKDQLLMRIDPTDYAFEVERLTRLKEQEYQSLRELDQEEVNAKRQMDLADQDIQLQQRELDRQKSLPNGFASQAEIDKASRSVLAAQQQKLNFDNQLDLLKKKRVRLEASERLAATQLKSAEVNLQRCEIRSPIEGVIVSEDAELNTFVARGSAIVTLEDTTKVEVATSLRMDQLHWILDQPSSQNSEETRGYDLPETPAIIEYSVSGRSGVVYRWNGRLLSYDGIGLNPQTRTIPVRVVVDDPQHYRDENGELRNTAAATALVRGMFVRVKFLIQPKTPLVVIPAKALKPGNRVWQFEPDESVLESSKASSSPTVASSTLALSDEEFDPAAWVAGKVLVRGGITPVDTLELASEREVQPEEFEESNQSGPRQWVCEIRDGTITANSFVVVSPLGDVQGEMVPARALNGEISKTSTASLEPATADPMETGP